MLKFYKILTGIFMVFVIVLVVTLSLFFLNADFNEFFLSLFFEEETIYASGYSLKAWKNIDNHDTVQEVVKQIGEPLSKTIDSDGISRYFYSKQGPKDTNYRMRIIIFNQKGKVIEKYREFYLD